MMHTIKITSISDLTRNNAKRTNAMKIANAPITEVQKFLEETFSAEGLLYEHERTRDMAYYASLAKFLSDEEKVARAAAKLAGLLGEFALSLNQHCQNGVSDPFLEVLRNLGVFYGFHPTDCYILDDQVAPADFRWVVSHKSFFQDAFTRPHGEYTHAVQWLLMAVWFESSSSPPVPVADLYARSVAYISKAKKQFFTGQRREPMVERIYLWNFLVDCFEGPDEDFMTNIRCKTYRCPQYVTKNLVALSPESWLGRILIRLRNLGNKGGKPAPSPRYDKPRPRKGNISYTGPEREKNFTLGRWVRIRPRVYKVVRPRILVH
jgi:Family of unknown function (DUF5636)